MQKHIDGKWQTIPVEDHLKMTKLDGQVWLSLYNLLLKEECQRKYDFNSFNKSQLLKVYSGRLFCHNFRCTDHAVLLSFIVCADFKLYQLVHPNGCWIVAVIWCLASVLVPGYCPPASYLISSLDRAHIQFPRVVLTKMFPPIMSFLILFLLH